MQMKKYIKKEIIKKKSNFFLGLCMNQTGSALSRHQSYILNIQIINAEHRERFSLTLASQSALSRREGQVKVRNRICERR